jgi:hypothetical protein
MLSQCRRRPPAIGIISRYQDGHIDAGYIRVGAFHSVFHKVEVPMNECEGPMHGHTRYLERRR